MGQTQILTADPASEQSTAGIWDCCIAVPCTGDIPFLLSAYPAGI